MVARRGKCPKNHFFCIFGLLSYKYNLHQVGLEFRQLFDTLVHPTVHTIYISLSLWFGDINTEIQMTMQRSSVGQSTHLSLAAADKGSILIQDNCWLSTGDQTSRLHISTDLLFPSLKCELTLTLDEPRQYLEKSDILQTKAILILDPYPLFWLLSVIAPVFSFCFSSEIFQENVWCILLTKLLQKHFWLLCNGRLSM